MRKAASALELSMNAKEMLYLQQAVPAAQAAMRATGIPASITLAQGALESGWLTELPPGSNNPFGIKAEHLADPDTYVEAMTTEYSAGVLEHVEQPFEKYATLADAFTDHARLLSQAPRYAPAMAAKGDAAQFATELMTCGYSTNRPPLASKPPFYADLLMELVREFDLTQYDIVPTAPATQSETAQA
jgi:flagellum-specific peptidoglycan hydrolase FlgJ